MSKEKNDDWSDKHPLISDLSMLLLPSILISASWLAFTQDPVIAIFQGVSTVLFVGIGLAYFEKMNKRNIFRYLTSDHSKDE